MGMFIEATCPCGFKKGGGLGPQGLRVGMGARLGRSTTGSPLFQAHGPDWAPAVCLVCRSVFSVEGTDRESACPACKGIVHPCNQATFYAVPRDLSLPFDRNNWETKMRSERLLFQLEFLCPQCEHVQMRFVPSPLGSYD
jgi:hypothetical protein